MTEKEAFFSQKHKQLLSIATWANYIAWFILVISFIMPLVRYMEIQTTYIYQQTIFGQAPSLIQAMKENPAYAISVIADMLTYWLKGIIYFLVARGVSLGLNMIVETDINYRENSTREEK